MLHQWVVEKNTHISLGQTQFSALIVAPDSTTKVANKTKSRPQPIFDKKPTPITEPAVNQLAKTEAETVQQNTETLSEETQRSKNAVRGNIKSRLSQYLSYPEFARRKGWQGIVVVALKVNDFGQLKDIHVNSSSGFDILDSTAIDALNKLNAIEVKHEFKLALNTLLEIPIHFKLQGS